ncbi:MAG: hypothetical protein ABI678_33510, partial [Kofleriaceae bacterium]
MIAASKRARVLVLGVLAATATAAYADTADDHFKRGRELLKVGKFREACEQFEKSQALDPALGTQFNIAQCDAETGKLATALATYREVVARDTNAARKRAATEAIARLEQRVPHLVVHADPGTTVTLAGTSVALDTPVPLDFGSYTLHAVPRTGAPIDRAITIDQEGSTAEVSLKAVPVPPPVVP